MKTSELMDAISADAGAPRRRLTPAFWAAIGVAVVTASVVFDALLGPRADIAAAISTVRFPWKFVVTMLFGFAAATLALRLARPGGDPSTGKAILVGAAILLVASIVVELAIVPSDAWEARLVGRNWAVCLINVPILSALPLAAILIAMRRAAPASPTRLGAAAGLLAGAIGATFYAAHCPDDSPLFVGVWYSLSVGFVTLAGAAIGSRLLRW